MTLFLQVMIVFIIIDSMLVGDYSYVFGGFIVLLLTMVPMIMEREVT